MPFSAASLTNLRSFYPWPLPSYSQRQDLPTPAHIFSWSRSLRCFAHPWHCLPHGWADPTALPTAISTAQQRAGLRVCVWTGLFLTSRMPLFTQGLSTRPADASHRPSDLTVSIPKPFITQHPYPPLKSPSHKANNLVVHFSVLLYISDCLSPSSYSTASIGLPSDPNLCPPLTATIVHPQNLWACPIQACLYQFPHQFLHSLAVPSDSQPLYLPW